MRRWTRRFAPLALGLTLVLGGAASRPALAQQPEPSEESSPGRPWDGYFAVGLIAGLALFLIGKSARR